MYKDSVPSYKYDWTAYIINHFDEFYKMCTETLRTEFYNCVITNFNIDPSVDLYGKDYVDSVINAAFVVFTAALKQKCLTGSVVINAEPNPCDYYEETIVNYIDSETSIFNWRKTIWNISRYVDKLVAITKYYKKIMPALNYCIEHNLIDNDKFKEKIPFFISKLVTINESIKYMKASSFGFDNYDENEVITTFRNEIDKYIKNLTDICNSDKLLHKYDPSKIYPVDIMEGYDAGWLSQDGTFYGMNGDTSELLHLNIEKRLAETYPDIKKKTAEGNHDIAEVLERMGWIKIHNNEVYGYMGFDTSKFVTDAQRDALCNYADKFYDGKILCNNLSSLRATIISTKKLRQMDKIALRNAIAM